MFSETESASDLAFPACLAKNKKGEPCGAPPTETGFCHVHSNPGRAAEIGREGGRRNRQVIDTTLPELPDLSTNTGVRDAVALFIRLIYAGRVNARRVAPVVSLFSTLQRAIPTAELEDRVKALENAAVEKAGEAAGQTQNSSALAQAASA